MDSDSPGVEVNREGPEYDIRAKVDYINRQAADLYTKWQHYQLGDRDVENMLITTTGLKEDLNELESLIKELQDHPQDGPECPDCDSEMDLVDPSDTAGPRGWECPECCRMVRETSQEDSHDE